MTEKGDIPMSWSHFDDFTTVPSTRLALFALVFTPIVWGGKMSSFRPKPRVLLQSRSILTKLCFLYLPLSDEKLLDLNDIVLP